MTENESTLDLGEEVSSIENHLNAGIERLQAWYLKDEESPEGFPDLNEPPHQTLIEESAEMMRYVVEKLYVQRDGIKAQSIDPEIRYAFYGISTERLLTGIHLKLDPEGFIETLEANEGKTATYHESRQALKHDLIPDLTDDQLGRVLQVLELIRKQRNNIVHFGFHQKVHATHRALIYQVFAYLITRYSEKDIDEVYLLEKIRKRVLERNTGQSHPVVEFDLKYQ